MTEWFVRGKRSASLSIDDRATQYGDGLFETIAIRDNVPRLWSYHAERLTTGCDRLGIQAPDSVALEEQLHAAIEDSAANGAYATAKIIVSAGVGTRGYRRHERRASIIIGIAEASALPASSYSGGVAVRICRTKLALQPQLAGIKTLNRLEQVLARREWDDESIFEGVTLDADGRVICGTMSNVFLIRDNRLVTPAITRCGISGVMRRHLLAVATAAGIHCDVRDVARDEIAESGGLLLTNSLIGALPVRDVDGVRVESSAMVELLLGLLRDNGVPETGV